MIKGITLAHRYKVFKDIVLENEDLVLILKRKITLANEMFAYQRVPGKRAASQNVNDSKLYAK